MRVSYTQFPDGDNDAYIALMGDEYSVEWITKLVSLKAKILSQATSRLRTRNKHNGYLLRNPVREWSVHTFYIIDGKRYWKDSSRCQNKKEALQFDMDKPVELSREDIDNAKIVCNIRGE